MDHPASLIRGGGCSYRGDIRVPDKIFYFFQVKGKSEVKVLFIHVTRHRHSQETPQ